MKASVTALATVGSIQDWKVAAVAGEVAAVPEVLNEQRSFRKEWSNTHRDAGRNSPWTKSDGR